MKRNEEMKRIKIEEKCYSNGNNDNNGPFKSHIHKGKPQRAGRIRDTEDVDGGEGGEARAQRVVAPQHTDRLLNY